LEICHKSYFQSFSLISKEIVLVKGHMDTKFTSHFMELNAKSMKQKILVSDPILISMCSTHQDVSTYKIWWM